MSGLQALLGDPVHCLKWQVAVLPLASSLNLLGLGSVNNCHANQKWGLEAVRTGSTNLKNTLGVIKHAQNAKQPQIINLRHALLLSVSNKLKTLNVTTDVQSTKLNYFFFLKLVLGAFC
jgi:hypothetical protein